MKVTFEFNTDNENCDLHQLELFYESTDMYLCLSEIKKQLREWYKYDPRGQIPYDEVYETLNSIIANTVNEEKLGL